MTRSAVVALAALASVPVGAVTPAIPTQYYAEARLTMPYYNLVEPITSYYCEEGGMGRLDYWGGVERYLYNRSGNAYQIVPTSKDGDTSEETCFVSGQNFEPISIFPDMTYFPTEPDVYAEGGCEVNGVACASWTLRSPTYNETSGFDGNYTLYVDISDGTPLRFHFTGFNVILGSHYDEYIFDYLKVEPGNSHFEEGQAWKPPPAMTCETLETDDDDSGGPTKKADVKEFLKKQRPAADLGAPLAELRGLFPQGRKERSERFVAWAAKHGKAYDGEDAKQALAKAKALLLETARGDGDKKKKALKEVLTKEATKEAKKAMKAKLLAEASEAVSGEHALFHRASLHHAAELFVNAMNRRRLGYWLDANHMADWTREERRAHATGRLHTPKNTVVPATKSHELSSASKAGDLPDEVDWRAKGAVTPPKDQGTCGSCWSYGATGTTEGQLFLKTGTLTPLSQQNLMDCSWPQGNNACDGGLDFRAYEWMLEHGGQIATESSYPYLNADGYCRFSSSTPMPAKITGYANITDGVPGLNDALATVGPISVSIDATPDSFYFYQGGLYYSEECKSGMNDLDHTVLAVGYTTVDGQVYSIVKNSWSEHWGDGGYVYISQQDNCCGVATQPTYVMLE